jgi:hypothetical protein
MRGACGGGSTCYLRPVETPASEIRVMTPGIPDHPTAGRWCKSCCDFKPLDSFPAGRRRFQCKEHTGKIFAQQRQERVARNPAKCCYDKIWHLAYQDEQKAVFGAQGGSSTTTTTPKPMAEIEACTTTTSEPTAAIKCQRSPSKFGLKRDDVRLMCEEGGLEVCVLLRAVPKDPRAPMHKGNVAIVTKQGRSLLAKIWKVSSDVDMYVSALEKQREACDGVYGV